MNKLEGVILSLLVLACLMLGAELWGEHVVQVKWDKDKAVRQALLDDAKRQNQGVVDDLNAKHQADLKAAKSEAGRAAVAGWLREHGLLPSGLQVQPNSGAVPPQGAKVPDGATGQQGIGGALEGFAAGCARDALMVLDWQELCVRNRCEVSE
ncbi:MAG TPA: hypothetical protein VK149_12250 [Sideroxyarcus sp.]|nr:hypothetical protein [Sideroxyarcus sp.]